MSRERFYMKCAEFIDIRKTAELYSPIETVVAASLNWDTMGKPRKRQQREKRPAARGRFRGTST